MLGKLMHAKQFHDLLRDDYCEDNCQRGEEVNFPFTKYRELLDFPFTN
jgi:hypothetical protein